jgi:acyl-CoA synthetase (AMP-forming)/AMP-acid ligase II
MQPLVVPDLIAHASLRYPARPCVVTAGQTLTFAEVSDRSSRLANLLFARGIAGGARVALLAENVAEFIEIRVGAQRAGSILVPLNYRLSIPELQQMIDDCAPELLIVDPECRETAERLSGPPLLWLGPGGSYEHSLAASSTTWSAGPLRADAIGLISYTSGTTGEPKGVMLSNWSLHATMLACGAEIGASPDGTYLASTPMFHLGAQVGLAFTYLGGCHAQLRKFSSQAFLGLVEQAAVTHTQLVPTMVKDVIGHSPAKPGALQRILYGAAPMPPALAAQVAGMWECELVNGYGSTEIMLVSSLSPDEHRLDNPGILASVGRSAVGMRSCVVETGVVDAEAAASVADADEVDVEASVGVVGEVVASGPTAMSGYWRKPEASAAVMSRGWVRTGDLGYRDDDGYLYLVDRKSDKIITGGENVFPSEVESVIRQIEGVDEVAVVGVPDDHWGQRVVAVVVPRPGADLAADDIIARTRRHVAGYKSPKDVIFVSALPRSATGKILRRVLRDKCQPGSSPEAG